MFVIVTPQKKIKSFFPELETPSLEFKKKKLCHFLVCLFLCQKPQKKRAKQSVCWFQGRKTPVWSRKKVKTTFNFICS